MPLAQQRYRGQKTWTFLDIDNLFSEGYSNYPLIFQLAASFDISSSFQARCISKMLPTSEPDAGTEPVCDSPAPLHTWTISHPTRRISERPLVPPNSGDYGVCLETPTDRPCSWVVHDAAEQLISDSLGSSEPFHFYRSPLAQTLGLMWELE